MGLKEIKEKLNYVPFPDQPVFRPGAYNPGLFKLNREKLKKLRPQIFGPLNAMFGNRFNNPSYMSVILNDGDMQTAVVVSLDPLLVACYTDEMDAVVMLRFPSERAGKYDLMEGTRLTTSNWYFGGDRIAPDIFVGEGYLRNWTDFMPIVQLFLGKRDDRICAKTTLFDEDVWATVAERAEEYRYHHPDLCRDGFYYFKK